MMRTLPTVLHPYGYFVQRDVYAVDGPRLHEHAVQSYSAGESSSGARVPVGGAEGRADVVQVPQRLAV